MKINEISMIVDRKHGRAQAVVHPDGGEFWLRPARREELSWMHMLISTEISLQVGPLSAMQAVFDINPDSFWTIEKSEAGSAQARPIGLYAFLPLNADGLVALKNASIDRKSPRLDLIAPEGTLPAAMYVWALVARRIGRLTYPLIKQALGPAYAQVPVYAIAETKGGLKSVADRGFSPLNTAQHQTGALAMLPTSATFEHLEQRRPNLRVVVASNAEHLQMSAFIRGATFGAEQNCPYGEEFDENDYCAMHLIGLAGDEPIATLRIRFFASFAKLERLAVLAPFRKTRIHYAVMEKAIEICRRKGYTRLYGQSQERLVGFYAKFGFKPMQKNRTLVFSDHAYVEIVRDLDTHPDPISVDSDPYLIIRPEGRWETEGVLEKSAARPATNPLDGRRDGELQRAVAP